MTFLSRSGEMSQTQLKGFNFEDLSQSFNLLIGNSNFKSSGWGPFPQKPKQLLSEIKYMLAASNALYAIQVATLTSRHS